MLNHLRRCAASVRDQDGVEFEHMVMDGASNDGTAEWLAGQRGLYYAIEKDNGMYDAVNKGFIRAKGEIISYLNCDEQYLPGSLAYVEKYFKDHPKTDILFGGALLIRPDGSLISYRKAYRPRAVYFLTDHLYVLSCAMFLRKRIIDDGFRFDTSFRANGDSDFAVRLLEAGYKAACAQKYLSAFTMTGENLSASDTAREEAQILLKRAPMCAQRTRGLLTLLRRAEKLLSGAYFQKWPLEYAVYVPGSDMRKSFSVQKADFRWKNE